MRDLGIVDYLFPPELEEASGGWPAVVAEPRKIQRGSEGGGHAAGAGRWRWRVQMD
jgi:hypothetical protein